MKKLSYDTRAVMVILILVLGLLIFHSPEAFAASLTVKGYVVKGPVAGASVKFYALTPKGGKGVKLKAATTDANGYFKAKLNPAPTSPFLIEATGGSFLDEVTGETVSMTSPDILTAALKPGTKIAMVTPLTHLAAVRARAMAKAGVPLKAAINAAYAGVARQYDLINIGTIIPVAANDEEASKIASLDQRNYGLVLAGLAQEAHNLNVRVMDLIAALAEDLSDGTFDGMKGSTPITVPTIGGDPIPLPATAGTSDLQSAINSFAASVMNKTAIAEKQITLDPVPVGLNGAGVFYVTSTALPAWHSGQAGAVTLTAKGGKIPYHCALADGSTLPPGFSITDNCVLSGTAEILPGGTTMRITPPFTIVMRDSAANPASANLELRVTIVAAGPVITTQGATIFKETPCEVSLASADGGTYPYYFTVPTFASGAPPLGTVLGIDGKLRGSASANGTYTFQVMAVDLVGATDTQPVTVVVKDPPLYTLQIQKSGNGTGTVYSTDWEIDCGGVCSHKYKVGTEVTLYAYATGEANFVGWVGLCSGTGDCTITMDGNKVAEANFSVCAENGESCDSTPCCTGTCVPNNSCPGSDPYATNVCYGPCGGDYPYDCGNYCCGIGYPACGGDCWCWEY
jgi:hypothetical protein